MHAVRHDILNPVTGCLSLSPCALHRLHQLRQAHGLGGGAGRQEGRLVHNVGQVGAAEACGRASKRQCTAAVSTKAG